jgi:hypothetical protein
MYLAAIPTEVSGLKMLVVAIVMMFSLCAWLGLVFLADRKPRSRRAQATELKQLNPSEQPDRRAA